MANDNKDESLTGARSVLNVDAQKELINYRMKMSIRMMLIIFPITVLVMLLVMWVIFKFVGTIAYHR